MARRASADQWNEVWNLGQPVGVVCPACQSPEEHLEAEVNAVMSPASGARWGDPKTEPAVADSMTREIVTRVESVIARRLEEIGNPTGPRAPITTTPTTFMIDGVDVVQAVIDELPPQMRPMLERHRDVVTGLARSAARNRVFPDGPPATG